MDRNQFSVKILSAKVARKMRWSAIAEKMGKSKEWTTAALLGQMSLDEHQAEITQNLFSLTAEQTAR